MINASLHFIELTLLSEATLQGLQVEMNGFINDDKQRANGIHPFPVYLSKLLR